MIKFDLLKKKLKPTDNWHLDLDFLWVALNLLIKDFLIFSLFISILFL